MRNRLIFAGVIVSIYIVFLIQALQVWNSTNPEVWLNYWLGFENITYVFLGGLVLFLSHISLVVWATVKKKVEWHWAIPLALMPFMIGVIIQGLLF